MTNNDNDYVNDDACVDNDDCATDDDYVNDDNCVNNDDLENELDSTICLPKSTGLSSLSLRFLSASVSAGVH